jgi:hypothetical protein
MMLAVRFLLELTALGSFGYWAFTVTPGRWRFVAMIVAPMAVAALWGIFAVPGDPSRSGSTVVATPGALRLLLELVVFFGGAALLYAAGARTPATIFAAVLLVYHAASYGRFVWLLQH